MLISRGMEMYEDIKVYFKKNCIEKLVFYIYNIILVYI